VFAKTTQVVTAPPGFAWVVNCHTRDAASCDSRLLLKFYYCLI